MIRRLLIRLLCSYYPGSRLPYWVELTRSEISSTIFQGGLPSCLILIRLHTNLYHNSTDLVEVLGPIPAINTGSDHLELFYGGTNQF